MYTTTLRTALPGPTRSDSETRGWSACICAQAESFERSRGLGLAEAPLSVTLPLGFVAPGAARSPALADTSRINDREMYANRILRRPPEPGFPEIGSLCTDRKRRGAKSAVLYPFLQF